MIYLGIFGDKLKKTLLYLPSAPCEKFHAECKTLQFGTETAFFRLTLKKYCHIWNQHPWICLIAKFPEKMKMPKFVTKNALFGYFGAIILKNYCHIRNQHPRICQIAKACEKMKMPKIGTKNASFGYFWARIYLIAKFRAKNA